MFPTHRRVLPRNTDNRPAPQLDSEPVLIGMEFAGDYTLAVTQYAIAAHEGVKLP